MNTLLAIQMEMKSPKSKWNKFGGFSYRTAEDILEAAKPILAKFDAMLEMTDDVILCGTWVFLKSSATLTLTDGSKHTTTGFARIDETKKGMDSAQITGSATSYARKYALGAMFLIDNEKDPDAPPDNPPPQAAPAPPPPPLPAARPAMPGTPPPLPMRPPMPPPAPPYGAKQ